MTSRFPIDAATARQAREIKRLREALESIQVFIETPTFAAYFPGFARDYRELIHKALREQP